MTQRTFGLLIFGNLIQREDIPQTGYSEEYQSITRMDLVIFYRHNEKRQSYTHQTYRLKKRPAT